MKLKETLWFDDNSQPPTNYLWVKDNGVWKYKDTTWIKVVDKINIQSDWEETDDTSPAYIKNKPIIPSIVQQNYLKIEGKSIYDCHLRAGLAKAIQNGTIFDVLITYSHNNDVATCRILSVEAENVYIFSTFEGDTVPINISFTATQYEGLAAIQDSIDDYSAIPKFEEYEGGFLNETALGTGFVGVNGNKLSVTVDDGKIAALVISDEENAEIDISLEDAQKLIGLPITE